MTDGLRTAYRHLVFEQVRPYLKLSKSPPVDLGPYEARLDPAGWYDICDCNGTVVGQAHELSLSIRGEHEPEPLGYHTDGGTPIVDADFGCPSPIDPNLYAMGDFRK